MADRERLDNPGIERLHSLDQGVAVVVGKVLPPLIGVHAREIRESIQNALRTNTDDEPLPAWRRLRVPGEEADRLSAGWATFGPTALAVARAVSGGKRNPEHVHALLTEVGTRPAVALDVGVGRVVLGVEGGWKFFDEVGKAVVAGRRDGIFAVIYATQFLATACSLQSDDLAGIERYLHSLEAAKRGAVAEGQEGVYRAANELTGAVVLDSLNGLGEFVHSQGSAEMGVALKRRADQPLAEALVELLSQLDLVRFNDLEKETLAGSQVFVGQNDGTDPCVVLSNESGVQVAVVVIADGRWLRVSLGKGTVWDYELDSTQRIEAAAKWVEACQRFVEEAQAQKAS